VRAGTAGEGAAAGARPASESTFAAGGDAFVLRGDLEKRGGTALPHLSMGMSHDFAVAVEEGATLVRGDVTEPAGLAAALADSGLLRPGTLYQVDYRLLARDGQTLDQLRRAALAPFDTGARWRDRNRAEPAVARFVDRLGAFLVLVGLVVSYVSRASATGVPRQHIEAQIRLFWSVFWWTIAAWIGIAVSAVASLVLIGIPFLLLFLLIWFLLSVWFTVKSVLGLIQLLQDRPI
jgi:uncharacterized membrane protein